MKKADTYKEFNNQNYLEVKYSKKSITEESIKEAKKTLEFKNNLILNIFLNKRDSMESDGEECSKDEISDKSSNVQESNTINQLINFLF